MDIYLKKDIYLTVLFSINVQKTGHKNFTHYMCSVPYYAIVFFLRILWWMIICTNILFNYVMTVGVKILYNGLTIYTINDFAHFRYPNGRKKHTTLKQTRLIFYETQYGLKYIIQNSKNNLESKLSILLSIHEYVDRLILQEKQEFSAFFAVLEEPPT